MPQKTRAERIRPATAATTAGTAGDFLRLTCFDLGKADSFLISTGDKHILIDTGLSSTSKMLLSELRTLGVMNIDLMILTHYDKDHIGGAPLILSKIPVKKVIMSCCPSRNGDHHRLLISLKKAGIKPELPEKPVKLMIGGARLTIDPPSRHGYLKNYENNISIITRIRFGGTVFLFMGDSDTERIKEYLSQKPAPCDFVKVPYHGRKISGFAKFLSTVNPKIAVITSSDEEPESRGIMLELREASVRTYLTRLGRITCTSDGNAITVVQNSGA